MATLGINYLSACEGGISFTIGTPEGEIGRRADTIKDGVELIKKYGIANVVFGSSSMDFASEEGFADDKGAKEMWNNILHAADRI
tara:strand:- start:360 stop:614 length:255 start_codon:yes stop_codon:yes gene_type:complete